MKCLTVFATVCVIFCSCGKEDAEPVSCEGNGLALSLIEITPASECGVQDGNITVLASGGESPYVYTMGHQSTSTGIFDRIASGVYSISATDKNGCRAELANVTVEAGNLAFSHVVTEDTDCAGGNGSVTISVLHGDGPFLFKLDEGEFQELSSFHNLRAGQYVVVLRTGDCTSQFNLTIPKGSTGTSWNSEVKPLIEKNCALSGCHNGIARPDLRLYETAKHYAAQIKSLTADRSMPFTGSLTQQEIDLLACWVDEGALQN
jgi:hypothetical protein